MVGNLSSSKFDRASSIRLLLSALHNSFSAEAVARALLRCAVEADAMSLEAAAASGWLPPVAGISIMPPVAGCQWMAAASGWLPPVAGVKRAERFLNRFPSGAES